MEMTVAIVNVSGVVATANRIKLITRGLAGAKVQIVYDSTVWIDLRKTVVFEGSGVTKDVLDAGEIVEIPQEVTSEINSRIRMGIYGVSDDGSAVVPTIWAELGRVRDSADPSGDESTAPELPVWAQLDSRVTKLEKNSPTGGNVSEEQLQQAASEALAQAVDGKTLSMADGVLSVNVTDRAIEGDARPITSGAVYEEFNKAVALLKTI